jgi:hypothetical protein
MYIYMYITGTSFGMVVCCVVTAFYGRSKWLCILVFNCVYVVNKLALLPSYFLLDASCSYLTFLWRCGRCLVRSVWVAS